VAPAPAGVREAGGGAGGAVADMALYEGDAIVRRALSLQQTRDAGRAAAQG
jgi:hypothetical protein